MSSATRVESDGGRAIVMSASGKLIQNIARLGMTPRQQVLNRLWAIYRCSSYDARRVDWDGRERSDPIDHEAIAQAGFLPPGFYDAGVTFPVKFRRPTAPYNLGKVIVDRFTGLLFSERRHPSPRVEGDEPLEDFIVALVEASRLWPAMIQTRTYGGAMGTFVVGFQFVDGRPIVEVHDPRWIFPAFEDRFALKLAGIEKRYMYPVDTQDPATGKWETLWYWYRRIIDKTADTVFAPVQVDERGEEPVWEVERQVQHGLGFCPVVWGQNLPVSDDIDGDPDTHGTVDMIESIDALLAQANKGVQSNCDPTLVIQTTAKLSEIAKGSDNALKLPDGSANYLEISGSGPKAALELADIFRKYVLEVAQCVLEHPDAAQRTATEVERAYSSMLAKADVLREQYGERCVKPLIEMMVKAVRQLGEPAQAEDGTITRQVLNLSVPLPSMQGDRPVINLQWPGYFEPSIDDALRASQAAVQAKAGGLIDAAHASQFVADHFRVEDVQDMMTKLAAEQTSQQDELYQTMLGQMPQASTPDMGEQDYEGAPRGSEENKMAAQEGVEPGKVKFFQYEIEGGLVTINEVRQSKGLGPLPDGHMTLPQYKMKHAQVYATQTAVETSGTAETMLGMDKDPREDDSEYGYGRDD